MGISTHILDTSRGRPADGVDITLERQHGDAFVVVARGATDADGRVKGLVAGAPEPGTWRIRFDVGGYHARLGVDGFYPFVEIVFVVKNAAEHYHVPLLINPFGYSTYRGS
jgi:5-hydroxyisourate hydrolase